MLNLGDILQFLINSFNQGSFSKDNLTSDTHERISHAILNLNNQLYTIHKQVFK